MQGKTGPSQVRASRSLGLRDNASSLTDMHTPTLSLQTTSDPAQLKMLLTAVELMCEIFYSLNYQVCSHNS